MRKNDRTMSGEPPDRAAEVRMVITEWLREEGSLNQQTKPAEGLKRVRVKSPAGFSIGGVFRLLTPYSSGWNQS